MMKSLILRELKRYYNFKKDVELARHLEITPQLLSNWDSRGTFDHHILYTKCVEINPDWILSNGQGQMLRSNYIKSDDKLTISGTSISNNNNLNIKIPIMDISATASMADYPDEDILNIKDYLVLPQSMLPHNSTYACVREQGNSMSPTLHDSDKIIIRLLDKSEWFEMPDEHVYVVVDKKEKSYIKRVKNRFNKGFIVCMSDNVDKANYPNFNIDNDDILFIWHVELHISNKMRNINDNYYNRLKIVEDRLDALAQALNK